MTDLTEHKTKNLFLIVGSNPLPNYVAAQLLTNEGDKIHLICTKEMQEQVTNLNKALTKYGRQIKEPIQVDEADAENIFVKVKERAKSCTGRVGLHYTGGTKAMAVHAYRAIAEIHADAVFSYLNARTLELMIDQPKRSYPVGLAVKMDIEELLALHGLAIKPKKDPVTKTFQVDFCKAILDIPHFEYRKWCDDNLRIHKGLKSKSELKYIQLPLTNSDFSPIHPFFNECTTLNDLAEKWKLKVDKLASFIDGIWLEHYTLWAIQEKSQELNINYSALSIWAEKDKRKFEFDVVAMRGYQLFAISCTTSKSKGLIKSKLFEAYVRARQMGGDEAKVGIVCYAPKRKKRTDNNSPDIIQAELEESWQAKGQIRVFGEEHLADLPRHIAEWFNQQPGGIS